MSMFTLLSDDFVKSIISEWLGMEDVAKLDSSLCNQKNRASFLEMIQSPNYSLCGVVDLLQTLRLYADWISTRAIKVREFYSALDLHIFTCDGLKLEINTSQITALTVDYTWKQDYDNIIFLSIAELINQCPRLTNLAFTHSSIRKERGDLFFLKIKPEILMQLTSFDFHNFNAISTEALTYLSEHCRRLTEFCIWFYDEAVEPENLMTLYETTLTRNPKLHSVTLTCVSTESAKNIISLVAKYCRDLKEVYIYTMNGLDLIQVADLIHSKPQLTDLVVTHNVHGCQCEILYTFRNGVKTLKTETSNCCDTDEAITNVAAFFDIITGFHEIGFQSFPETSADKIMRNIANNNPHLGTFYIGACDVRIPLETMQLFLTKCTCLTDLDIHNTYECYGDVSLFDWKALISQLSTLKLKKFRIYRDTRAFTEEDALFLLNECPTIVESDLCKVSKTVNNVMKERKAMAVKAK